jgi:hypothetical protein
MFSHTLDLAGEALLTIVRAYVLDHRIAEYDLEGLIAKGQLAAVARDEYETAHVALLAARRVEQRDLWPRVRQHPVRGRAAHIEDSSFLSDSKASNELPHSMRSKSAHGAVDRGTGRHTGSLTLGFFNFFHQRWNHFEQIANDSVIRYLEDGRVGVLVNGHDGLGALHADQVLDRA